MARFVHRLRVRFADSSRPTPPSSGAQAQAVVSNVSYFLYLEVARIEYFRALGLLGTVQQTVAEACVQYRAPARFDDEALDVHCRAVRAGKTSLRLGPCFSRVGREDYEIHRPGDGTLIATGHTIQVVISDGRPRPIPDAMRERLREYEAAELA